ncbi:MAG: hypothetical protein LKE96_05560 [Acetobacter peroxydans]|nr:hypothetical protein [Acetobacter peroxydans]MCI2007586.1 hypothetical protein [Acetobacter peroxydans]MCI2077334.1 hypothetical protein [Acetobacter peroxydans]
MTRGPGKAAAKGALWKRWLARGAVIVAFAYLCTLGLFFLVAGRPGNMLFQSIGLAVMPLLIVGLFALPGRVPGGGVGLFVLVMPLMQAGGL